MGFTNPETDLLTATAAWVTVVEIKLCSVLIKTSPRSCTRCRAPKNMTTHHCYRKDFHFYTNDLPRYFHLGGTVSSFSLYRYRASDTEWPSQSCYTSLEWQSHWSASYSQNPPAAIGNDHCLMETNLLHLLGWNKRERFRPQELALKWTHLKMLIAGREPSWEECNTKKTWTHTREIWLHFF